MGYTPLFDTLTKGTLCGRWPDIGLWPIVLSMADKHGIVDNHPNFISGVTGLPVDQVIECMARFCAPDPRSRSDAHNGARLVLLDAHRDWGWRIVNFDKYREKARLAAKNAREVESGENAARLRGAPDETAAHRRSPPPNASQTQTQTHTGEATSSLTPTRWVQETGGDSSRGKTPRGASRVPEDFSPDLAYARAHLPDLDAEAEAQKFRDHEFRKPRKDWAAAWRNWVATCRESGRYARNQSARRDASGLEVLRHG